MKHEWTLGELLDLFPEVRREPVGFLRCVAPAVGHGRYVKDLQGRRQFGDVQLRASPAAMFLLKCNHEWPEGLPAAEAEALERALLRGIAEGTVRFDEPIWGCQIESMGVAYRQGHTTPVAVSIAASLAVRDLVDNGAWVVEGSPSKEPA